MTMDRAARRRANILCAASFALLLLSPVVGILVGTGQIPWAVTP